MQKKVFFITSNPNKARECKNILSFFSIYVEIIKLQISEIQSDTLEEIARFSSLEAVRICKKPVLVEDSGLFINVLNGFPGPYSSYIQNKIGNYAEANTALGSFSPLLRHVPQLPFAAQRHFLGEKK